MLREISAALHGLSQRADDNKYANETNARLLRSFQDLMHATIKQNSAAMKDLSTRIDNALKVNREVVSSERQIFEGATKRLEETGEHLLASQVPSDEITGRHVKKFIYSKIIPWLVENGVLLKMLVLAIGAGTAIWALLSRLAHRL